MVHCTLIFVVCACVLTSASRLGFPNNSVVLKRELEARFHTRSNDDELSSRWLFKRTRTKAGSSRKSTGRPGLPRSHSSPDLVRLGVMGGGVKAKPRRSAEQVWPGRYTGGSAPGTPERERSFSPRVRSATSGSPSRSGGSASAMVGSSAAASSLARSTSTSSMSSISMDSLPGHGMRGLIHSSNAANSPRTSQSSLGGSFGTPTSIESRRNSLEGGPGGSVSHSVQANNPETPRNQIMSTTRTPNTGGSTITNPSASSVVSSIQIHPPHFSASDLQPIHDSPSSISSVRARGDPRRQRSRQTMPRSGSLPQGFNQVQPESPGSRVDSMAAETGSPSGRGSRMESLGRQLQRMRFGQ